jgi:hypothetical protein
MSDPGICLVCGGSIPEERRADAAFCSAPCKAAAKYEREALLRTLTNLTTGLAKLKAMGPGAATPWYLGQVQGQIDQAKARLRELLAAAPG